METRTPIAPAVRHATAVPPAPAASPAPAMPGAPASPNGAAAVGDASSSKFDAHTHEGPGIHDSNFRFPPGFLWGAATSAHQVEGNNVHNDWWAWEQAGKVGTPSGIACDHFRRYREDFDLAASVGHNAHRFSLEWSRIEPEEGVFSEDGIAHYRDVIAALRERGIEPVVTIHHYTLPRWLAERGGWERDDIVDRFERYTRRVVAALGDQVRWWITLNEPVVQVFKGWIIGQWPPGKRDDFPAAFQVVRHLLRAHVKAYHAIHELRPDALVGVAKHALSVTPCNPNNRFDRLSVWGRNYLFNHLFLDALHHGALRVPGLFWERLPQKHTLDFVGLNFYTRDFVKNTGLDVPGLVGNICTLEHHQHVGKRNSLGWEVYPEGMAHFLQAYARYRRPILITENGIPTDRDEDRWTFILLHLWQVARAIQHGVPVAGYLYWSLLDNYEWADGYDGARFGLIGVDFETQRRTVRDSARKLAEVIAKNEL